MAGHNSFRVDTHSRTLPRVASPSFAEPSEGRQPWAGGHNPFGIELIPPDTQMFPQYASMPAAQVHEKGLASRVRSVGLEDTIALGLSLSHRTHKSFADAFQR